MKFLFLLLALSLPAMANDIFPMTSCFGYAIWADGSGYPACSHVLSTELNYLQGATANIQAQINAIGGGGNQSANTVQAGPTSGSPALPTYRALVGADLPNPSSTTLGGVQSKVSTSHQWLNSISTSGVPASSQPAFTDISGSVSAAQLPNPSSSTLGGIQSYAAVTHQWINTISTSGVPASSQPAFTDISGTATNSQLANMNAHTFKGNNTGGSAAPTDMTATQATAELNAMVGDSGSGGTKGLAPAPASGDASAGKFLKADGTWAVPSGGGATETSFTLPNNSAATNLTGATCDSATYRSCTFSFDIYRKTDTGSSEVRAVGSITFIWSVQSSTWYAMTPVYVGDDRSLVNNTPAPAGVTFSASGTTVLQVQVATDNVTGSNYVGKLNWKLSTTFNL